MNKSEYKQKIRNYLEKTNNFFLKQMTANNYREFKYKQDQEEGFEFMHVLWNDDQVDTLINSIFKYIFNPCASITAYSCKYNNDYFIQIVTVAFLFYYYHITIEFGFHFLLDYKVLDIFKPLDIENAKRYDNSINYTSTCEKQENKNEVPIIHSPIHGVSRLTDTSNIVVGNAHIHSKIHIIYIINELTNNEIDPLFSEIRRELLGFDNSVYV